MRHPILNSILLHGFLFLTLLFFSYRNEAVRPNISMSANLVYSDKKLNKDHLPKKVRPHKKKVEEKNLKKKIEPEKKAKAQEKEKILLVNHADVLKNLAHSFVNDQDESDEPIEDYGEEAKNYFDQIYILLKNSFVLPLHINTIKGESLHALLRLFIDAQGNLSQVSLEDSSGDEHFDKAVMDGAKRVNNFGPPPKDLLSLLNRTGVVVELCPFVCKEQ